CQSRGNGYALNVCCIVSWFLVRCGTGQSPGPWCDVQASGFLRRRILPRAKRGAAEPQADGDHHLAERATDRVGAVGEWHVERLRCLPTAILLDVFGDDVHEFRVHHVWVFSVNRAPDQAPRVVLLVMVSPG